jgi:rod shape-determining protein MreD
VALRLLRFAGALLAMTLLHFAGAALHPQYAQAVDLFVVLMVAQALGGQPGWALFVGLVIGLVQDTFNGKLYGLYGSADTLVAYLCAVIAQRVVVRRVTEVVVAFFAAAAAQQALLIALALAVLPDPGRPEWWWVLVKAVTAAVLGGAWYLAAAAARRRVAGWRRGRNSRLQFGR